MTDDDSVAMFERRLRLRRLHTEPMLPGLAAFLGALISIAFWGGLVYVAAHFVLKCW